MTRKRTRESLLHHLTEPCAQCEGKGYTKSRRTIAYELLRELRRQGGFLEGDTVVVEVHPDVAQSLATTDRAFLEDMEKRLQKRILVKARGSFHLEDFEIRTPGEKPIEKSEFAGGQGDRAESRPRKRRKRVLGSPEEVEALLEEEERQSVNAESLAEMFTEVREQKATDAAAAVAGDEVRDGGRGGDARTGSLQRRAGQQPARADTAMTHRRRVSRPNRTAASTEGRRSRR